jgi:HD-GYP domain-containing protein (c-di-GMP phosphodiesterase class II)/GGDEF domain-containing protein
MPSEPPLDATSPLHALRAAAEAACGVHDLETLLTQSVGHMARLLGVDRCSILLVEGDRLRSAGALGLSDAYVDAIDGIQLGPEVGTCGRAAATAQTTISPDLHLDPNWAAFLPLADEEGLRSCWSVPLIGRDGAVLATFATYSGEPRTPSRQEIVHAETLAAIMAVGIESHRHHERAVTTQTATIHALTSALDARDAYTKDHSAVTAELAVNVGRHLGLEGDALAAVEQAAVLHDIGKLGIPNEILHSPDPLTPEQWALMRTHPEIGERILSHIPGLEALAKAVRHEHERWDGRGYPDGLAGDRIPLASRIVFACDAYHAMTSDRPYRAAMGHAAAREELQANAGTQFDPQVVVALLGVLGEAPQHAAHSVAEDEERARTETLHAVARALGAEDVFVFRRVGGDTYAHVGGVGRGEGWAGNVEVDAEDEPHVVAAVASGVPRVIATEWTDRIVGPYYGRSAVIVPGDDVVVVFGSPTGSLVGASPEQATALAAQAADLLREVSPAKRLADELEVLDAVRSVMSISPDTIEATLSAVADRAASALSCEFGAVVLLDSDGPRTGWSDRGWRPEGDGLEGRLATFARAHAGQILLEQDTAAARALVSPLGECEGAAAVHVLPVGANGDAMLLVIHAEPVLRGFTTLCRRVASSVADASETVIRRAAAQERLARENADLALRVRTDALTGTLNQDAWREIVMAEELHRSRHGVEAAVVVCSIEPGDELRIACADVLRACARGTDVVASLGSDAFAVLLRYCDAASAGEWCARFEETLAQRNRLEPALGLAVAYGWAVATDEATIGDAFAEAGRRMRAVKPA